MSIDQSVNKGLKQVDFNISRSGNSSGYGGGSYVKSNVTCHKCFKKVHIQKECMSNGNGSSGKPPKKYANELPEWVTKKPVVSDTKDHTTATMNRNSKKYNWCTSFNNGNGVCDLFQPKIPPSLSLSGM